MTIEEMKTNIDKAKEDLTRAKAVMGEVKASIEKEIENLKSLGVDIPEKKGSDSEYYQAVLDAAVNKITSLDESIEKGKKEIEAIIAKWDDDSPDEPF